LVGLKKRFSKNEEDTGTRRPVNPCIIAVEPGNKKSRSMWYWYSALRNSVNKSVFAN